MESVGEVARTSDPAALETAARFVWATLHGLVTLRLSGHLGNGGDFEPLPSAISDGLLAALQR